MNVGWYLRRLSLMGPCEVAARMGDRVRQAALRPNPRRISPRLVTVAAPTPVTIPADLPPEALTALVAAADRLVRGSWPVVGHDRTDMRPVPDWFLDPVTGIRAPSRAFSPSIEFRDPSVVGSVKRVWEPSRHNHLTVLAAAHAITGEDRYADMVERHLRDWLARNPFMSGIHWTSGIEVGIRLISWVWTRRLLSGWAGAVQLFEDNPEFIRQCYQHQYYLSVFPSHGSSANNHLLAEAAGLLVASCGFPMFDESARWERLARVLLEREVQAQTFPSGVNRELATDYHGFAMELALVAALEADVRGRPVSEDYWAALRRMWDALASIVDVSLRPPRQGDADDGRGILLDAPEYDRWVSLLSVGRSLFGAPAWWPAVPPTPSIASVILPGMVAATPMVRQPRTDRRRDVFGDAGLVLLRTEAGRNPEIWVRFDCGPHGFLSIASHAHADALSLEVRLGGVDVLADPGTYAYHSEPAWRTYFRSARAHNTLTIDGADQSESGGPFMWTLHASSSFAATLGPDGEVVSCSGTHDGYRRLPAPVTHRRSVHLDRDTMILRVEDDVEAEGSHAIGLTFHLGPAVDLELNGACAHLEWDAGSAQVLLPEGLTWDARRGVEDPPAGWYSPAFGVKVPSWTMVGEGEVTDSARFVTEIRLFDGSGHR
jgi:hypothetical protein